MKPTRLAVAAIIATLSIACAPARAPETRVTPTAVPQLRVATRTASASIELLIAEGTAGEGGRSRASTDLEHLTDVIGPRLTGSPALRRANEWIAARLRDYGVDSVGQEAWPFGVPWQRGPLTMRMLAPHQRWLHAASWGWTPGTNGPAAGDVVFVDATTREQFDQRFAGRLRGTWVMLTPPYPHVHPAAPTAADSARVDSLRRVQRARADRLTAEERAFLAARGGLLASEGIAGQVIDAGKQMGVFIMGGSPAAISAFPRVVVGNETYAELHRLLSRGERPRIEVNATNTFGRDSVLQWNTVGEIRGSELPQEIVILGAHLDSWDLGTGATDNAAASIAVLEAARLLGVLKASGIRPRRTIRFVFFTGEEQGLYGSQYYVARHSAELPRIQAVLVLDNGTGRIRELALQGHDELHDLWSGMFEPLASLGPFTVRSGRKTGTDHLPFEAAGVPAFNYDQLPRGYDYTWHSQLDVFDHAVPEDVAQAATVMAVNALQLANLEVLLPRRR